MNMRKAIVAALRRDPELVPKVTESLREKIEEEKGPMATVVQAAEALEPILAEAFQKRPSRLGKIGLKSAEMLAGLAAEDARSNGRLAAIAAGKTVGIVFVDVSGFTTYTASHGDEAASELISNLEEIIIRAIKPVKGECVKQLGDGFLLAFPSASQAVRGAVSLRAYIEKKRRRDDFPLDLRISVHAGEPLVEQDDLLGHDVNLTARLLECCEPGEVVVSDTAKELADRRLRKISFGKRREVDVRGLGSKVVIYSVNPDSAARKDEADALEKASGQ